MDTSTRVTAVVLDPISSESQRVQLALESFGHCDYPHCDQFAVSGSNCCWDHTVAQLGRKIDEYWRHVGGVFRTPCESLCFNRVAFSWRNFDGLEWKVVRKCSFVGAVFSGIDFSGFHFEAVDFTGAQFVDCFFLNTTFKGCQIRYALFQRCNFNGARLSHERIIRSLFAPRTLLSKCNFEKTMFKGVKISADGVQLKRTDFTSAVFVDSDVAGCDFSRAVTENMKIRGRTNVSNLRLTKRQLRHQVTLDPRINPALINETLLPSLPLSVRRDARDGWNWLQIQDVRLGVANAVHFVVNCATIGALLGLAWCCWTRALQDEAHFFRVFIWSWICSASILALLGTIPAYLVLRKRYQRLRGLEDGQRALDSLPAAF